MFIDEAEIQVESGRGGMGFVSYFPKKGGPSGGIGGKGGDVYFTVNRNMPDLRKYIERLSYKAESGQSGGPNRRIGHNGKDLILQVPYGTTIIDIKTGREMELTDNTVHILVCKGGTGGLGNDALKSATNQTPKFAKAGLEGQTRTLQLILKLIAEFGLIGLPNAGKSSLLNMLTAANVKTASYPFTTLEPNLGVYNGKILADIPGLIEGASLGKGLGIRFLKHIEKVRLLLHCIAVDSENVKKDYQTVMGELSAYSEMLKNKESVILLTKIDLAAPDDIRKKTKILRAYNKEILPVSIYDETSLKKLRKILMK